MRAGQPLGIKQGHRPGFHAGDRFLDAEDALDVVGRIDVELYSAGERHIGGLGDAVLEGDRLGLGEFLRGGGQGGGGEQGREQGEAHGPALTAGLAAA